MDYVAEAKRMFDDNDYQWKNALAFDLHQKNPQLTARWAILCAERLLETRFPDQLVELQDDLEAAKRHLESFPESDDPEKLEYEIWYRPNRDAPQTAISKLFTAIRERHQRKNCVRASGAVIHNLTSDSWREIPSRCTSADLFNIVLQSYFDIIDESQTTGGIVG